MGLGDVLGALVTERAWELPAVGASLRERWAAIAPDLARNVAAVGYDADSGRLTVCPESTAWATKLRLERARVIAAANTAAGRTVVRAVRILAPGSVPMSESADGAPPPAAGPVRTREAACEGYRRTLAAHRAARPDSRVNPPIAQAVERQNRALREQSRLAFPETVTTLDGHPTSIEATGVRHRRETDSAHVLALRRARAERAARQGPRRADRGNG
ncbi:DUF721 domain-containing protein [Streptomyces syringium]|uniref:DUF721 domain-containing protein n=1 Tax=Streptomyces syringium TaxID=76729 RepID=UPI0034128F1A